MLSTQKLADSFAYITNEVPIGSPEELKPGLESLTASVFNILEGLNDIILAEDFDELAPSDVQNAEDWEYDTVVDGFIPENPQDAYNLNVMKTVRLKAVDQVNAMTETIDEVARQVRGRDGNWHNNKTPPPNTKKELPMYKSNFLPKVNIATFFFFSK